MKPSKSEKAPGSGSRLILYVILSLGIGGAERHIALIAPRLARRGWRPIVYCLNNRGVQAEDAEKGGVQVIGPPFATSPIASRLVRILCSAVSAIKLSWVLFSHRPAIVHFFLPEAYIVGAPLALLARVPVRLVSRRSLNVYQESWPGARMMERKLHGRMSAILGNSKRVIENLIEDEGCDPRRVGLIYNGVDLTPFDQARPSSARTDDIVTFVTVANLLPYKGHSDLLQALAMITERMTQPWRLLCVGRDDGCGAKLKQLAQQLCVSSNVVFLGERRDVPELLIGADVGILCSHQEGFSNAVLEGMAAGLPMVVTDVGGNAEAVVHGETGLVVPSHDPPALGESILKLARDASLRVKMGRAGRQRAIDLFGLDACVERYDRLYRALLQGLSPAAIEGVGVSAEA